MWVCIRIKLINTYYSCYFKLWWVLCSNSSHIRNWQLAIGHCQYYIFICTNVFCYIDFFSGSTWTFDIGMIHSLIVDRLELILLILLVVWFINDIFDITQVTQFYIYILYYIIYYYIIILLYYNYNVLSSYHIIINTLFYYYYYI